MNTLQKSEQIEMVNELIKINASETLATIKHNIMMSVRIGVPIELLHVDDRKILDIINEYEGTLAV